MLHSRNSLLGGVARAGEVDGVYDVERKGERPSGIDTVRLRAPAERTRSKGCRGGERSTTCNEKRPYY